MFLALLTILFSEPSLAVDAAVSKSRFKEQFQALLPNSFCGEKAYFRNCFGLNEESCKKLAVSATAACLAKMDAELPPQFKQPTEGAPWGEKLGACAGEKFETESIKTKVPSAECKDAAKWK